MQILWKLPVPSTALLDAGPTLEIGPSRTISLVFRYETEDSDSNQQTLAIQGVEAFKCVYYQARDKSALEAYDQLVDCGSTTWLSQISENLNQNGGKADGLKHMMINFDDGPCYEFLCRAFKVEPS